MAPNSRTSAKPSSAAAGRLSQPSCKSPAPKKVSKVTAAAVSASLLVFFTLDAVFGDAFWAALSGSSTKTTQCAASPASHGWCLEWTFLAWVLVIVAWCVCILRYRSRTVSGSTCKLQKSSLPLKSHTSVSAAKVADRRTPSSSHVSFERFRQDIDQAAREGKVKLARSLLSEVEKSHRSPDGAMPNMVMRAYAKNGDMQGAELWLQEMKERGYEISACTYNTIMDACVKCNRVHLCEKWLARMTADGIAPNAVSFTTALYGYAHKGDEQQAELMLERMKAGGVQPDAIAYNALIHACSVKGNISGVERWINEMECQGIEPSVTTFTAAIDACAKQGEVMRAEAWMERMHALGLEPNVVSFSSMMDACAKAGSPERAAHWYDRMVKVGVTPNSHSFSAAIAACSRRGDVDGAEQWLARAQASGVTSDPVVYSGVIDACGKANDPDRAWKVFEQMRDQGVRPHIVLYAALARPFAHRGDFKRVEEIAAIMEEAGDPTNDYFLYAHLLSYSNCRPKESARAEAVFKKALSRGVHINDHVLNALSRTVGRARANELSTEGSRSDKPWCTSAQPTSKANKPPWRTQGQQNQLLGSISK